MHVNHLLSQYDELKSLTFSPEDDIAGTSLPINEFSADIVTDSPIPVSHGNTVSLVDERGGLWACYYATDSYMTRDRTARTRAQAAVYKLEHRKLTDQVYQQEPVTNVLDAIFAAEPYTLHTSLQTATVTGFCPEQTARERLTWVCFVLGAHVVSAFREDIYICPIDATQTLIPLDRTFSPVKRSHSDLVTSVKVTSFNFSQATEEQWKADDSSYKFPLPWIAAETTVTLNNPNVPQGAPENVVEVDELYLVNPSNVSAIATRLAAYYFNNTEIELDCVNNRQFRPGDRVLAYVDPEHMISGYVRSAAFKFGTQARSTLKIVGVEDVQTAVLTVNYKYNGDTVGGAFYLLPVGYAFEVENLYLDKTIGAHRYILRPDTPSATGTMASGGNVVEVTYSVALNLYNGILQILNVDGIEISASGEDYVGVIE